MLQKMGVDIWRFRHPVEEEMEPAGFAQSLDQRDDDPDQPVPIAPRRVSTTRQEMDAGDRDSGWSTEVKIRPGAEWVFVVEISADPAACEKLFNGILFALGLKRGQVSTLFATRSVSQGSSGEKPTTALASLLQSEQPAFIIVLGEALANLLTSTDKPIEQLRGEEYRYKGGSSRLLLSHGLAHLLENPADKLVVWQDLHKVKDHLLSG